MQEMPKTEIDKLRGTLNKLADELCRQSKARQKREIQNDKRLEKILTQGLRELDLELGRLGKQFFKCCSPHRPGADWKA
jgi:hypothetical protein